MNNSECIVAINTDEKASIFKSAHYCIVGDIYEVIPRADCTHQEREGGIIMAFKMIDSNDIQNLCSMIGDEERVLVGEYIKEEYCHDELGGTFCTPDIVIRVLTAQEISDVMRYAYEHEIPVTPRGAGTGLVGSCVPWNAAL